MGTWAVAQLGAPTFFGLLESIWSFVIAWAVKYWWAAVIVWLLWYSRHYQDIVIDQGGRVTAATPFNALQETIEHVAEVVTLTTARMTVFLLSAVLGFFWILKGFGEIVMGATHLEPVMVGNLLALVGSVLAGFGTAIGVGVVRPRHVLYLFVAGVLVVYIYKAAVASSGN